MMAIIIAHFSDPRSIQDPTHSSELEAVPAGWGSHFFSIYSFFTLQNVSGPPEIPIRISDILVIFKHHRFH